MNRRSFLKKAAATTFIFTAGLWVPKTGILRPAEGRGLMMIGGGVRAKGNLLHENFEAVGYDDADWTEVLGAGGSVVDQDNIDIVRPTGGGAQVLKVVRATNEDCYASNNLGSNQAVTYTTIYIWVGTTLGANGVAHICNALNSAPSTAWYLELMKSVVGSYFRFVAWNNVAFTTTDSDAINTGQWYKHQIYNNSTAGQYEWKLDGVQKTINLSATCRAIQYLRVGGRSAETNTLTFTVYYDLIDIDSVMYI